MSDLPDSSGVDSYRCGWSGQRITVSVRDAGVEVRSVDRLGRVVWTRSVPLTDLSPTADHTWHKHVFRHKVSAGVVGAAIPLGTLALLYLDVSRATWLWFAAGLVVALASSVAYSIVDPARVEYAWFRYRSGVSAFTIGSSGPDSSNFGSFVAMLERRIREAGPS
jgi:hypothetical protein